MEKTCKNCGINFQIVSEESELRNRISSHFETGVVPAPTHCPDCRMQRRMSFRNERFLYNRNCSKTGKQIISGYPEGVKFPVYERSEWWKDDWDALNYGIDFDFSRPFFEQFEQLLSTVPRPALNGQNTENSDYCNFAFDAKDCYLSQCVYRGEALLYCYWLLECKSCIDCSYCFQTENCVGCLDSNHSYNCFYCVLSHNCSDSYYLYDCRRCRDCFACVGLRDKSYCLFNEQFTKEEYEKRIKEFDLQDEEQVRQVQERLEGLKLQVPHLYSIQDKTENCSGDYIFESKNCHDCYQVYRSEDCMYVQDSEVKNCLDGYHTGWSEMTYEVYSPIRQTATAFCSQCWDGSNDFYSDNCRHCAHCFGCVGLLHKKYCILNKQYTKEEYEELMPRIVEHMKKMGEWGEFFPIAISPFPYNETMAQEFFPLSKEKALEDGYAWRDTDKREYRPASCDFPNRIKDVPDSIVNEVLACVDCGKNYKVISQELNIYRRKGLSVPKKCPDCRNAARVSQRNSRKLWSRKCDKCDVGIRSTYVADCPETVYCEKCYLQEMY